MILTLITVGKTLEALQQGQNHRRTEKPDEAGPQTACVLRSGEQITVPVSEVNVGDLF